ncbi:MAG: biotin--[acetyl-CoA-carboxylase] ligase [Vulcanimicrobiaceae bacterium]
MWTIRHLARTQSTNDDAAALLGDDAHAATAIVADVQHAGRGRHDRAWIAPLGTSLLCTTILPGPVATSALWAVPFWTGLALADAIETTTGVRATLQWPNDLLVDGAKCAGILCVSRVVGSRAFVGCGTGINVRRPSDARAFADVVPAPAFLSDFSVDLTRDAMLDALLAAYARRWADLAGDPNAIARAWERRAELDGTPYRLLVDGTTEPIDATARAIAADGSLVVDAAGTRRTIGLADARVLRDVFAQDQKGYTFPLGGLVRCEPF